MDGPLVLIELWTPLVHETIQIVSEKPFELAHVSLEVLADVDRLKLSLRLVDLREIAAARNGRASVPHVEVSVKLGWVQLAIVSGNCSFKPLIEIDQKGNGIYSEFGTSPACLCYSSQ